MREKIVDIFIFCTNIDLFSDSFYSIAEVIVMQHLYYESLRRRILTQHKTFPLLDEKIQRAEAGIYGEMLFTRESP